MIGADGDPEREPAADDGMWVRPYTATNGRTRPALDIDLLSLVVATGRGSTAPEHLGYDHATSLRLCRTPTSVAEVAAHLKQPIVVTKVLLSDLIEDGALIMKSPDPHGYRNDPIILEAVIAGLRRL